VPIDRPDPDLLLARVTAAEAKRTRGSLKVFFGACAGVGKTYAMLEEAQRRRAEGIDVVVGWAETHGRSETEALLDGLEILPARELSYRGIALREMDLDAALERKPQLIVVDELAHTNAPGSRHAKRWRDVAELLDAGIDVYSTLNVQHVESLNDVVAKITGVKVRETVPDRVLEEAELKLVDLPPEELLTRLAEGKVYLPKQAEVAAENFFREGNLIALRELALRRAAEQVDAEMQRYRAEHAIAETWPAAERLLVLVAASPYAARLVRAARRMARSLRGEWIVLNVATAREAGLPVADREQLRRTLAQAELLGAEVVTLSGDDMVEETLAYARRRNVTKIVVGKPLAPAIWQRWRGSLADRLIRASGGIDVYVISGEPQEAPPKVERAEGRPFSWRPWGWTAAVVAGCTLLATAMRSHFDLASLIMVYLVGVLVVATRLGRAQAIAASVASVALFDFFFVPPHLSFSVASTQHLLTFVIMLGAALVMGGMASRIRQQAVAGRERERRTEALLGLARVLAGAAGQRAICEATARSVGESLEAEVVVLVRTPSGELEPRAATPDAGSLTAAELTVARWVLDHGQPAGRGTDTLPATGALQVPVAAGGRAFGVLAIRSAAPLSPDQVHLVEAFASQAAVALERSRLAGEAREAVVQVEAERFRNDLLSTVSHDLRTPLAAIAGASSSLLGSELGDAERDELARTIYDESRRLERLLADILQVTRLESGAIRLEKEWQPIEEAVGAAISRVEERLGQREVTVSLPDDLPLVPADGLLLEQVFYNLLDNAAKYTPDDSEITLTAWAEPGWVVVEVADRGPGLPTGSEAKVFDKFTRLVRRGPSGVGLGLTICRGIVAAHGGTIWAENRAQGGVAFRFRLPLEGTPPAPEDEGTGEVGS
jgi:two-component system sensor histidine kinase KdpD